MVERKKDKPKEEPPTPDYIQSIRTGETKGLPPEDVVLSQSLGAEQNVILGNPPPTDPSHPELTIDPRSIWPYSAGELIEPATKDALKDILSPNQQPPPSSSTQSTDKPKQ